MPTGEPRRRRVDQDEQKLLERLRLIAGIVILVMIVLIVVVDTLGRLYIDPSFHASEVALGTLIGALLLIVGIEGAARLRSAASDLAARPPRIDPDRPPDGGDA